MGYIMQLTTAINQIQKEADFLGLPFLETLEDIKKHGRIQYSQRTMEAYTAFLVEGYKFFGSVE